jgi:hypothetical protein
VIYSSFEPKLISLPSNREPGPRHRQAGNQMLPFGRNPACTSVLCGDEAQQISAATRIASVPLKHGLHVFNECSGTLPDFETEVRTL